MTRTFGIRALAWSAAVLALATSIVATAALEVNVTKSAQRALPIAIVPFATGASAPATDVAGIVRDDLASTGLFDVTPPNQMPERPSSPDQVNYAAWQAASINNLVVGSLGAKQNGYQIEFRLIDTVQKQTLSGWQVGAQGNSLRNASHVVANLIYKHFIGKPGYFLSRLAYVSATGTQDSRKFKLVVSAYDGHAPSVVFSSKNPIMSPAWSPDGKRIAYVAFDLAAGRTSLRVQDLATGNIREISSRPGINGAPAWSPDGSKLALTLSFEGNPDIYVYDLNSGAPPTRLTRDPAIDTEASWSPDGRYIAFTSDRGGRPQIYRMPSGGGSAKRLTYDGVSNQSPVFGPLGKRMAMVRQSKGNGYRIAVRDLDGERSRIVSSGPLDDGPDFAPNGQALIYATQTGQHALVTVSINGAGDTRLSQKGEVRDPAWGPASR